MRTLISLAVFIGLFVATTIACTCVWETVIKNQIYHCTDDLPCDYLQPGQWVHHPIVVDRVPTGGSMSEPDTVKRGWSVSGLWLLWFAFVAGSLFVSFVPARLLWSTPQQTRQDFQHTNVPG